MRLVTYVTAELESEIAADPLLAAVGWSWLTDALDHHEAEYTAIGGTVTLTVSTRFGELAGASPVADLEIRASWTPVGDDFARARGGVVRAAGLDRRPAAARCRDDRASGRRSGLTGSAPPLCRLTAPALDGRVPSAFLVFRVQCRTNRLLINRRGRKQKTETLSACVNL